MKHVLLISLAVIIVSVGIVGATYLVLLEQSYAPVDCGHPLSEGNRADFAGGGSMTCEMELKQNSVLTGGFSSNASMIFYLMNAFQYSQTSVSNPIPKEYIYTTGNTTSANVSLTLSSGTYYLAFFFFYKYQIISTINGTAWAGETSVNITQTFVATPLR